MTSARGHRPPRPGPLLRFLLRWRLDASRRAQLESELAELYEHRLAEEGADEADRWIRREYRRWCVRLLTGVGRPRLGASVSEVASSRDALGSGLVQDLRHNVRALARAPLFTAAVVLTVGLGVGSATLVYAVVHAVLIAPLPYPDADRLVLLRTSRGDDMWSTSMADVVALSELPPAFEAIAAYRRRTVRVNTAEGVDLVSSKWVTDTYFPMLGIEPVDGRHFRPEESRAGGAPVVLITERYRDRVFGPAAPVLGRSLTIGGESFSVVGVLPNAMGPLDQVDLYPALQVEPPPRKGPFFFPIVARLGDGVDPATAREQLDAVAARVYPQWRDSFPFEDATLRFVDLKEVVVGSASRALWMVLTGVGFLLLIAASNAASLLVARGVSRQSEVSLRAALGASGPRLLRLLLGEAAVLATLSALVGAGLAMGGMEFVRRAGAGRLPRVEEVVASGPVLAFLLVVTFGSALILGGVASASVLRRRTARVASTSSRTTASVAARRLRRTLVAAQFAVSIPLLVGAGLLGSSLQRLQAEDMGFDPDGLVSMDVVLPSDAYATREAVLSFWDEMLPRLEALAEVESVGLSDARPPVEYPHSNNFELADRPTEPGQSQPQAPWITADPGYFGVLGIRLLEGRAFDDPRTDTMRTALVDEAWAERYFPGATPLGRRFRSGGCTIEGCPWIEVAGVVSNVKTTGLDDARRGTIYYDFRRDTGSEINLHVRARGEALEAVGPVRRLLRERDPSVAVADVRTAAQVADEWLAGRRYTGLLVALIAGAALLLSLVGIYGAMSYFVRQHTRDIGIRIALGGGPASALRMVLGQGLTVAALGTLAGVLAALALTGYMRGLLYDVAPRDPVVFLTVCAGTLLVAVAASAIPAHQAAVTDPAATLREE